MENIFFSLVVVYFVEGDKLSAPGKKKNPWRWENLIFSFVSREQTSKAFKVKFE